MVPVSDRPFDIIAVGDLNLDLIGLRVAMAATVGEDVLGDFLLAELERAGVDASLVQRRADLTTGVTVSLSLPRDRAFATHLGAIDGPDLAFARQIPVQQASHVHCGSYYLQRKFAAGRQELFRRAKKAGCSTSLDPGFDPEEQWGGDLVELAPQVDVFLPNETEAPRIAAALASRPGDAADDLSGYLPVLARRFATVVVKLGPEGAAAQRGAERVTVEGFEVDVADTTCCGDAFNAGFIQAFLRGDPLEASVRRGNACGALVATQAGNAAHLLRHGAPDQLIEAVGRSRGSTSGD